MRIICLATLLLCLAGPVQAQEPHPFGWPGHEDTASRISDWLVAGQIGAETITSWRAEDRAQALGCQALRTGLALGVNELVKRLVRRERPDGSDRKSFYSMHSSLAAVNTGWRFQVGVPIALSAGYLRLAARKHFLSDVMIGGGVGLLMREVCVTHREK